MGTTIIQPARRARRKSNLFKSNARRMQRATVALHSSYPSLRWGYFNQIGKPIYKVVWIH